jgi:hypothetical protein
MSYQAYVQTGVTQVLGTGLIKQTYKLGTGCIRTNRRHTGTRYRSYQANVQTGVTQVPGTCLIKHTYKQVSHRYSVQVLSSKRTNSVQVAYIQTGITQVLGTGLIKQTYKIGTGCIRTNRRHTGTRYRSYQANV